MVAPADGASAYVHGSVALFAGRDTDDEPAVVRAAAGRLEGTAHVEVGEPI
jgi:hypothetical protein